MFAMEAVCSVFNKDFRLVTEWHEGEMGNSLCDNLDFVLNRFYVTCEESHET